jgi:uncharacterized protein (DUF697 family)
MNPKNDSRIIAAETIISNAAIASSTAAGALSQIAILGLDNSLVVPIIVNMIIQIGKIFDKKVDQRAAVKFLTLVMALYFAYSSAKALVGLVPFLGNVFNAAVTFPYIELVGWIAYEIFKDNREISDITEEEIMDIYKKRAEKYMQKQ